MADHLAKEAATQDTGEIALRQNTKRNYNYRREGDRINKMAGAMDKLYNRSSKQIIFPTYKRENEDHTNCVTQIYSYCNRSRFK
jgi:hypothetical protein